MGAIGNPELVEQALYMNLDRDFLEVQLLGNHGASHLELKFVSFP